MDFLVPLENLWVEERFLPRSRMDFFRHGSGVPWLLPRAAPSHFLSPGPSVPWAHRRPGYPWSGCVPAEPDSVFPGQKRLPEEGHRFKCPGTPEPCLENPRGGWGPGPPKPLPAATPGGDAFSGPGNVLERKRMMRHQGLRSPTNSPDEPKKKTEECEPQTVNRQL